MAGSLVVVSRRVAPVVPAPAVWAVSVYVGRPSALGNPFSVSRYGSRPVVIQLYRRWLWAEVRRGLAGAGGPAWVALLGIVRLVAAGTEVRLACWCSPLPCHADVVASAVRWLLSSGQVRV
jgi:hypothetical protein